MQTNNNKLREALERVLSWLTRMNAQPLHTLAISELTPSYAVNRTAKSIIEDNEYHISQLTSALAEPPRQCDEMPTLDQLTMHDLAKSPCQSTLECASREELLALVRWLLSPATKE